MQYFAIFPDKTKGTPPIDVGIPGLFLDPVSADDMGAPLELVGSRWVNGKFQLRLLGKIGERFVIEASTDFRQWTPILTNSFTSSAFDYFDPESANFNRGFYPSRQGP